MAFSTTNQPTGRGRPKHSKNKRGAIKDELTKTALKKLEEAVVQGEQWAIQEILKRTVPTLKPITQSSTPEFDLIKAQTELARLKALEISELEQRIQALENSNEH